MHRLRFAVAVAILLLVLIAAASAWAPQWTPSRASYPTQGIDVSAHQGNVAWSKLSQQGVDFAYIKATEGGDFRDKRFAVNWALASQSNIPRGAYHYFTLCRSGAEQAANFLGAVPVDAGALPPAVDLEFLGNCSAEKRMGPVELKRELRAFLDLVERRTGKPTLLYLTQEFDEAYQVSRTFNRPLWLRRIVFEPGFGAQPWTLWQASNFRRLEGIEGRVDWNVARLTWPPQPPHSNP